MTSDVRVCASSRWARHLFRCGRGFLRPGLALLAALLARGADAALPWSAGTLPPGGIAWWQAEGDFAETLGAVAAAPAGAPPFAVGVRGQALRLDGASQWLRLGSGGLVRGRSAASVAAWVRPRGRQGGGYTWGHVWFESTASTQGSADNYTRFSLAVDSGGGVRVVGRDSEDGAVYALDSSRSLPSNAWTHVVATWKAGVGLALFLNGAPAGARSEPGLGSFTATAANYVMIGASRPAVGSETFNGDVDDLMLFDRALSAADAAWLCAGPWPSGLSGWWRGEEDASDALGAHPGAAVGALAYTNGPSGQAFLLNGTDAAVALGGWFNLQAFTLSLWLNPAPNQALHADLVDNNHDNQWSWVLQSANNGTPESSQWLWGGGGLGFIRTFWLTKNAWQMLTITMDSNHVSRLYLNGKPQYTDEAAVPVAYNGTQYLDLGKWGPGRYETRFFSGAVDEFMVYDRALEPEEVAFVYARQAGSRLLDIRRQGAELHVSWPATTPLLRLQASGELQPAGWVEVGEGVASDGLRDVLPVSPAGQRFYRLQVAD